MNRDVWPYHRPDPEAVRLTPWKMFRGGDWQEMPALLPDWDPATDLLLVRECGIDRRRVLEQARLPEDARLAIAVEWQTSLAGLCGIAQRQPVVDLSPIPVNVQLRGVDLSGTLSLVTRLVLADDLPAAGSFAASHAGEVLYEDVAECRLQGVAGMFPMSVVDFSDVGLPHEARWHLMTPSDLDLPAMGGLRLYLNRRDAEMLEAARNTAGLSAEQGTLLRFLRLDITRQLVDVALGEDHADELDEFDERTDTFGAMLRQLLRELFDDESVASLTAQRRLDPERFATRLQAAVFKRV